MSNGSAKKGSFLKVLIACLIGIVVLGLVVILCLPLYFSSSSGKNSLIGMIEKRTGMKVQIEKLSLSWFGSQSISGLSAQKPEEALALTCHLIESDASLLRILFKNDVGQLHVVAPQMTVSKPFTASVKHRPFQSASFAAAPQVHFTMPAIGFPFTGDVAVENGQLTLSPPGARPIAFTAIALNLELAKGDTAKVHLTAETNEKEVHGQISLQGSAANLKTSPTMNVQAAISHLPVRGIDEVAALFAPQMNGLLLNAIGSSVDLHCDLAASSDNIDLLLDASSPNMSAHVAAHTTGHTFELKDPASFQFTATPQLFQLIGSIDPAFHSLTLTQPSSLQIALATFSIPLPIASDFPFHSSFEAQITASPLNLSLGQTPVQINNFILKAASSTTQGVLLNGSMAVQSQGKNGNFAVSGNLNALSVSASNLPVDLFTPIAASPVPLSTLLGPAADMSATFEMGKKIHLSWKSPLLDIPSLDMSLGDTLSLAAPFSFTYQLTPSLAPGLAQTAPLKGTVKSLVFPTQNLKKSQIDAALDAGPMTFSTFPIRSLRANLKASSLDQIVLDVTGDPLQASLSGSLDPQAQTFTLNKPLTAQVLLPSGPKLAQPATVQFSLDPMTLPLSAIALDQIRAKGQLSSAKLALLSPSQKQITLNSLAVPFQWDGKAKTAALQISSQVQNPSGEGGSMQGQMNISNISLAKGIDLTPSSINGSLDLTNISSSLLDIFLGKAVSPLIGASFTSKLKVQSAPDRQNLSLNWASPYLNASASFLIDKNALQLQGSGNQATWILTPEGYQSLDRLLTNQTQAKVPFEIKEPSTFTLALSQITLPVAPSKPTGSLADRIPSFTFDFSKLQFDVSGSNPKLTFIDKTSSQGIIQLSSLDFTLNRKAGSNLTSTLNCSVQAQGKTGSLAFAGTIAPTLDATGAFDLSRLTTNIQFSCQQLPSRALDIIARAKGRTDFPFTALFGDMVNASVNLDTKDFSGPVAFNLNSPLTRASLKGTLAGGALTLNEAIHAQVKITPEMSRLVLKEVNPLDLSYFYSSDPVTLEIPARGFYLPLYPSNIGKAAIPNARLELGKISCKNEGNVHIALDLLKAKQIDKSGELTLWFAPLDLHLQKGIADIERTEILLANTFDVCLFGNVDLVKKYVDMVLGLTAQTLSKAFGIKNLPENYVLTIPMRGPMDNVQINSGKATAKIALLLAWQQKNALGGIGGKAGGILGGILDTMATLPDFDAKVPPAKHPFPWEKGRAQQTSEREPNQKKRHFKQKEKPIKQILKVIK